MHTQANQTKTFLSNPTEGTVLLAPMSGPIYRLEDVPDPVFAGKMAGDGLAIDPQSDTVHAPMDGTISFLHRAKHAFQLTTDCGLEILVHVGLDTVKLDGRGFRTHVRQGDRVKAGAKLLSFDVETLESGAKSLLSLMLIVNHENSKLQMAAGKIAQGQPIMQVSRKAQSPSPASPETQAAQDASGSFETARAQATIQNPTGLHARPAAVISQYAKAYQGKITLSKDDKSISARSTISLLGLEMAQGETMHILVEGPKATWVCDDMRALLEESYEKPGEHKRTSAATKSPAPANSSLKDEPNTIRGVAASGGHALGQVARLAEQVFTFAEKAEQGQAKTELRAFHQALAAAEQDLVSTQKSLEQSGKKDQASIFAAHREILTDPEIIALTEEGVQSGQTAGYSWQTVYTKQAETMERLKNELFAARANDLRDVGRRVSRYLAESLGETGQAEANTPKVAAATTEDHGPPTIVIAEDVTPSDVVALQSQNVVGLATTRGSATSHVAILAKSLGLPCVAGAAKQLLDLEEGKAIAIDGDQGLVFTQPSEEQVARFTSAMREEKSARERDLAAAKKPATTLDGQEHIVCANIAQGTDAQLAVQQGADGVGLLRSEFLFLHREDAPDEAEQSRSYREVLAAFAKADYLRDQPPLIIRTLDVGGDKPLKYLPVDAEDNPFLGIRGLRLSLQRPDIFRTQIRSLLTVAQEGDIRIMLPMVTLLSELREAKQLIEEERLKLNLGKVKIGIMIEVPSAAIMAEQFAAEVDFFSIGTNDLTQYVHAIDRTHGELAHRVDGLHPAVLRLMQHTAQAAHKHSIPIGICGGIAGDPLAVPLLVGMGVEELSVSPKSVPQIKARIRELQAKACRPLLQAALQCTSGEEVRRLVQRFLSDPASWLATESSSSPKGMTQGLFEANPLPKRDPTGHGTQSPQA